MLHQTSLILDKNYYLAPEISTQKPSHVTDPPPPTLNHMSKLKHTRLSIAKWMRGNLERFIDRSTDMVNSTQMVEAWDLECDTGGATLDEHHIAWDVAVEVTDDYEGTER